MRGLALVLLGAPLVVSSTLLASCVGEDPDATPTSTTPDGGGPDGVGGGNDGAGDDGATNADANADATNGVDIDGHVTDVFGRPVPGATVRVGTAMVNTDTSGHFHLAAIAPTYDLDVLAPSNAGGKTVTSFRGLTTRTPEANVEGPSAQRQMNASGTISPTVTLGTNEHIRVSSVDTTTGFQFLPIATDETSAWSGTTMWTGGTTANLTFWMVEYASPEGTEGTPTSFTGYATLRRNVMAGVGDSTLDTGLIALTTANVQGSVANLPAPATSALVRIALKSALDRYGLSLNAKIDVTGSFSLAAPTGTGLSSVNVIAQAGGNPPSLQETHYVWKANAASNATGIDFVFGTAARPVGPANAATAVKNDAAFTWSAGSPAGVYELKIRCGSGTTEYVAKVYTTATMTTPSDASALGAAWPTNGASCQWGVRLFQKVTTVDAIVSAAGALNELDHPNGPKDGAYAETFGYGFTTP